MAGKEKLPDRASSRKEVDQFLQKVASTPVVRKGGDVGRLIFAMDATASREHAWDKACQLQGEMFRQTSALGGLEIQLAWYRGLGEFKATPWYADSSPLLRQMTSVRCRAGITQVRRLLSHAIEENAVRQLQALVFVGDAMEENIDELAGLAGQLGILNVPLFLFQEGHDPQVASAFKQLARLSGGAWCPFDASSADQLGKLLSAVAIFAAGGRKALEDFSRKAGSDIQLLTRQLGSARESGRRPS